MNRQEADVKNFTDMNVTIRLYWFEKLLNCKYTVV